VAIIKVFEGSGFLKLKVIANPPFWNTTTDGNLPCPCWTGTGAGAGAGVGANPKIGSNDPCCCGDDCCNGGEGPISKSNGFNDDGAGLLLLLLLLLIGIDDWTGAGPEKISPNKSIPPLGFDWDEEVGNDVVGDEEGALKSAPSNKSNGSAIYIFILF